MIKTPKSPLFIGEEFKCVRVRNTKEIKLLISQRAVWEEEVWNILQLIARSRK